MEDVNKLDIAVHCFAEGGCCATYALTSYKSIRCGAEHVDYARVCMDCGTCLSANEADPYPLPGWLTDVLVKRAQEAASSVGFVSAP